MKINNYVWEKEILLNDLVLKQKEEIERLHSIIEETKELLSRYNDNESNYYVPIDIVLNILEKGE